MVVPALLFLAFNGGTPAAGGWGIPMATDIAFAVGLLALLGKRIPPAARILLLALAVVDDLGSILVIALFYSSTVHPLGLLLALAGLAVIISLQKLGVRSPWSYLPAALATWAGTYITGVHPTIAGVAIGLLTPIRPEPPELAIAARGAMSPADYLYNRLHRWVAFVIMPAFAFANAGMTIGDLTFSSLERRVVLGVALGLVIGKPVGVLGFAWLAVRSRLAVLPAGVGWSSMLVVGLVAGVGFTIALFISSLAFASETLNGAAKLGILVASTIAAVVGLVTGRVLLPRSSPPSGKTVQQHG
jgi:NhaA family Na+:H+ antiporter